MQVCSIQVSIISRAYYFPNKTMAEKLLKEIVFALLPFLFRDYYFLTCFTQLKLLKAVRVSIFFRSFCLSKQTSAPLPMKSIKVSVPFQGFNLPNSGLPRQTLTPRRVSVPFRGSYLPNPKKPIN